MKRILYGLMLAALLSAVMLSNVKQPEASGTIYIRTDGTIEPNDGRIITEDKVHYKFTTDIHEAIVVERSNIVVNGTNHTVEGLGSGTGIKLASTGYVTLADMTIKVFETGVEMERCSSCVISRVTIVATFVGIKLHQNGSENNTVSGNNIAASKWAGIEVFYCSSNNRILKNTIDGLDITDKYGIYITDSPGNYVCENAVANNKEYGIQVEDSPNSYIWGNSVTKNKLCGINVYQSPGTYVWNNSALDNKQGINFLRCSNSIVDENNATSNGEAGIALRESSDSNITRNQATYNNATGILHEYSYRTLLHENIAKNNGGDGIHAYSSSYSNITRNIVANNGLSYGGGCGLSVDNSLAVNVVENSATGNHEGIATDGLSSGYIFGNSATSNEERGVQLYRSSNLYVAENGLADNGESGFLLWRSNSSTISRNQIINNGYDGITLYDCFGNVILENIIAYNRRFGINTNGSGSIQNEWPNSSNNLIYHNNFIINKVQVAENCLNYWDNGSINGGNHWSDYEGMDQNGDGIGDTGTPHHKDRYPFIVPTEPIPVFYEEARYDCLVTGNVTVNTLSVSLNKTLDFKTIGRGWLNLTIPRELLGGTFRVFINNTETLSFTSWNKEHTNTSIYFECKVSGSSNVKIEAEMKLLGDINGDGTINILDISIVARRFGQKLNP